MHIFNKKEEESFEKRKRLMTFNAFIGQIKIIAIGYGIVTITLFFLLFYIIAKVKSMKITGDINKGFGIEYTELGSIWDSIFENKAVVIAYIVIATIAFLKIMYKMKVYHGTLNKGQKGHARWATRKEIKSQYKEIPEKDIYEIMEDGSKKLIKEGSFKGKGGVPIAREGDKIYIDDTATNTLVVGTSRSGKGEEHVLISIDILSRAEEKSSMIIGDPKLELAPATIPTLEARGYECHLLNLIDPEFSMGYNPIPVITREIKRKEISAGQQLCRSLAFNVFPDDPNSKDGYWTEQARNVFIAAIMADINDNLRADIELNKRRRFKFEMEEKERREKSISRLEREDIIFFYIKEEAERIKSGEPEMDITGLYHSLTYGSILPKGCLEVLRQMPEKEFEKYIGQEKPKIDYKKREFVESKENEEKITIYSIIKMVNTLNGTKGEGKEKTALDNYFSKRDENDFARQTYASIESASANTKGTIMSEFQRKVSIFLYDNIAKMTSKNSLNMIDVGFGEKPVAIFIGLPDYDSSNYFIATVFINQLYFTLAKMATAMPGGRTIRDVVFLLDEFGNLPAIDNIESIVSVCLGRGMRFHFIIQAFSQITALYGEHIAKTIRGNCGNLKYILTTELETAKEISEELSEETVTSLNRSGKLLAMTKEFTESQEEKRLLNPWELMHLKPRETVILRYLKRQDNKGNSVRALAIANMGEYQMKFRYDYLLDTFPADRVLYRSRNLQDILDRNPNINTECELAGVEINNTTYVDLDKYSRNVTKYLEEIHRGQNLIKDIAPEKQLRLFNLMEYPTEKRKEVKKGEDPAYLYTVEDFVNYARSLTKLNRFKNVGYELLDILDPISYEEYREEEIFDKWIE